MIRRGVVMGLTWETSDKVVVRAERLEEQCLEYETETKGTGELAGGFSRTSGG